MPVNNNKTVSLQDLDIFSLLRLSHLTEEEKLKKLAQMQKIVLTDFININLPNYLKDKEIFELEKLAEKKASPFVIENFLRKKIKDFDVIMVKKFLKFKKELVKDNIQIRLDLNKKETERLKSAPDGDEKSAVIASLDREKNVLNRILTAIDRDEWRTVSDLIQEL